MKAARTFRAKVFKTGGSQAIRLPKECRMSGDEVAITVDGARLILEPVNKYGYSPEFVSLFSGEPDESLLPAREQPPVQRRDLDL